MNETSRATLLASARSLGVDRVTGEVTAALEAAGVEFIPRGGGGGPGVRLKE